MRLRPMRAWPIVSSLVVAAAGCAGHPATPAKVHTLQPTLVQMSMQPLDQSAAGATIPTLIHLDVYEVEAPVGDLSGSDAFWSMVRPGPIAADVNDRLGRNALRCGLADKQQWPRFRALLDALPCRVRKVTFNGPQAESLSLDLSREVDSEDLFYFDAKDRLQGRSFQLCTNFVSLAFLPIDGYRAVRIALTPVVRSRRARTEFSPLNHEFDSPFESTDHLFDVDLHADVPDADFMVVGPARGPLQPTSIGGAFFVDRGGAELLEQVLVIVPTYLRVNGQRFTLLQMPDRR